MRRGKPPSLRGQLGFCPQAPRPARLLANTCAQKRREVEMIELLKRTSCFQAPDLHTALNMLITDHSSWFLRQQPSLQPAPECCPFAGARGGFP